MVEQRMVNQAKVLISRKIEAHLKSALFQKGIIVLHGSRQVGKTSLMLRLILYLLEEAHINPNQMIYFDLEFPHILSEINNIYGEDFLNLLRAKGVNPEDRSFIFIDEVHYLDNPSSFLKTIYDHYPQIQLIVSGSSSFEIKRKFKESLTGRKKVFEITPVDFEEFLAFKGSQLYEKKKRLNLRTIIEQDALPDISELKFLIPDFTNHVEEFIRFGGYPGVVLCNSFEGKILLLAEIYRSYIRRDIKDFAHIENVRAFNRLIELLSYQIAGLVNLTELSNSLNISRQTVENYLYLLENTFVITLLSPYYTNRRQELVKSPKVFFHDTGLRNSIIRNMYPLSERMDKGSLFENAVFKEASKHLDILEDICFWRTKSKVEVDFVIRAKDIIPIEVKYQPFQNTHLPSGLRSFIKCYHPPIAILVTGDFFSEINLEGTHILFVPIWVI